MRPTIRQQLAELRKSAAPLLTRAETVTVAGKTAREMTDAELVQCLEPYRRLLSYMADHGDRPLPLGPPPEFADQADLWRDLAPYAEVFDQFATGPAACPDSVAASPDAVVVSEPENPLPEKRGCK